MWGEAVMAGKKSNIYNYIGVLAASRSALMYVCTLICMSIQWNLQTKKIEDWENFGTKIIICQDFRSVVDCSHHIFVFPTKNLSRKIVPQTEERVLSSFQLRNHCKSNMRQDPDAEGINIPALNVLSLASNWNPEALPYYLLYADEWVGDQEAGQVKRN